MTVRLIKIRYTDKGNLLAVIRDNAYTDDLLEYAPTMMSVVQKLGPESSI
jgi:hypothetical protein